MIIDCRRSSYRQVGSSWRRPASRLGAGLAAVIAAMIALAVPQLGTGGMARADAGPAKPAPGIQQFNRAPPVAVPDRKALGATPSGPQGQKRAPDDSGDDFGPPAIGGGCPYRGQQLELIV
ncbi:MAG: hypothetical protein KDJ37_17085 [Hyphomicrobiaceae bacterium]|nr:hypothetical protein [Hyphomicrobiaceae bacterium]